MIHINISKRSIYLIALLLIFQEKGIPQSTDTSGIVDLKQKLIHVKIDTQKVNYYNEISSIYIETHDYSNAEVYAKKAISLSKSINYKKGIAIAYFNNSIKEQQCLNYSKTVTLLDSSLLFWEKLDNKKWLGKIYNEKARTYELMSESQRAKELYFKSLNTYQSIKYTKGSAGSMLDLGRLFTYSDQYDSALIFYEQAEKLCQEINDTSMLAMTLKNIGMVYTYKGIYEKGLAYYFDAIKIFESTGNIFELARAYNSVGASYHYQDKFDKALEYYQKSYELMPKNNYRHLADIVNNIADIYRYHNKLDTALMYYNLCLEYDEKNQNLRGMSITYGNLASVYYELWKPNNSNELLKKVIKYYKKAIELGTKTGYKSAVITSTINLGDVYQALHNYNLAIVYYKKALNMSKEIGKIYYQREVLANLHKAYVAQKKYKEAYESHVLFKEISDSLLNEDNIRKVAQLEMQYEFDKENETRANEQEKERLVYEAKLKHQKLMRNGLFVGFLLVIIIGIVIYRGYIIKKRADAEKEVLLKEIHHRVKNNLQMISSLLDLQTWYQKDLKIKEAVKEGQSRVRCMALIHQLLYQEESLTKINMNEYIGQLLEFLTDTFQMPGKNIEIEQRIDNIELDIETSIPLGLIITELVSNAFKYAFQKLEKGKLTVKLQKQVDKQYILNIQDNGIGVPDEFSYTGNNTLGLRLVHILAEQINGKLQFISGDGLQIALSFNEPVST